MDKRIKTLVCVLSIIVSGFCSDDYLKRIVVPSGTNEEQVLLSRYDNADNRYSLTGFFVDDAGNAYFQEEGTGKIKIFNECGRYQRTIKDHKCKYLFLHENDFIGQRQNNDKTEELIFFSKDSGTLTYRQPLSLGAGEWAAYKIKNGMILFSSDGPGYGSKKAFDISKRAFVLQGLKEWDNSIEQKICSTYVEYGAEPLGKLNNYYLFWFPPPPKDTTYEYSLRAAKIESGNIAHIQTNFKRQDVGLAMQGLTGALVNNRYIYTVGHPKTKGSTLPEIWVTRIDLKVLMPVLWNTPPDTLVKIKTE